MSYAEIDKFYYPNTNHLFYEVFVNNGKKEGKCNKYYKSGELYTESNYINNKRNGIYKKYNKDGELLMEFNYINNKREGKAYFFKNNYKKEINYINGKKEGSAYLYKDNILYYEFAFKNNKQYGEIKSYYDNGSPNEIYNAIKFKKNGIYRKYNANNSLLKECNYKNNLLYGDCKIYENDIEKITKYYYGIKNKIIIKIVNFLKLI
jgi:antitoxin component YwqK of YwqJK toxin-antitoxin module